MYSLKRAIAALALLLLLPAASAADIVDRVVAIINDDVITLSEVNEEGKALLQRVAETVPPAQLAEAVKKVRQQLIEKLIEKKIMLQEAEKAKIAVTDEEVDLAFKRIMERNKMTPEQFQQQLASIGMDEKQYRENLKDQVLGSKLVNLEIRSKIIIPEDRIIDYYDTHYTERVGQGGYYLLQIGIAKENGNAANKKGATTDETAREKAERVHALAVAGKDFRELAKEYSSLPSAVDGGDIGVLNEGDMPVSMRETIRGTRAGQITPLIETSSGYQFFKVLSSQDGQIITKVSYESVKDEIYEILYQQEIEARYAKWLKEMKGKAYIKIL